MGRNGKAKKKHQLKNILERKVIYMVDFLKEKEENFLEGALTKFYNYFWQEKTKFQKGCFLFALFFWSVSVILIF